MERKIILGSALLISMFIMTFLNIGVINKKNIQLNVNEPVLAIKTVGYTMQNKACPGSAGLYARCIPWEDEFCDVSAQTLCD